LGINPGGVMDHAAARVANLILGNPESSPVLEMHFPAAEIEFESDTTFALAGADFDAVIGKTTCRNYSVSHAERGSILRFRSRRRGQRAYMAIAGGLVADSWFGSSSTNMAASIGGIDGRALKSGDRLEQGAPTGASSLPTGKVVGSLQTSRERVRITQGPEFDFLTAASELRLLTEEFSLKNECDRMGYRLSGPGLTLLHDREMVSSAVTFGTIQLLPDGQLIVLMADHQTTGGYPRVANVISVDLPLLAQRGPGEQVQFDLISIGEAERLAADFGRQLNFLRVGCRLQTQNANR
jgi:antagonist of KipI